MKAETKGLWLGLLGVAAFSITLPATRAVVAHVDPLFVSAGRSVVAAALAIVMLLLTRARRPTMPELKLLVIVALGVVIGFPLLMTWAMRSATAAHGTVVLGILPLTTAVAGAIVSRERPSKLFWAFAVAGSAMVVVFAFTRGAGAMQLSDLALLGAAVCASVGYAMGARLSKTMGGLQVIAWALVVSLPLTLPLTLMATPSTWSWPSTAWLGFAYLSVISQFLGFLPWYKGLALGGTARVGQTQLLQPFMTLAAAALLLGERIDAITVGFAVVVVALVAAGRKAAVANAGPAR
jgi:drug/metabolite transporter (DMT)-like permease